MSVCWLFACTANVCAGRFCFVSFIKVSVVINRLAGNKAAGRVTNMAAISVVSQRWAEETAVRKVSADTGHLMCIIKHNETWDEWRAKQGTKMMKERREREQISKPACDVEEIRHDTERWDGGAKRWKKKTGRAMKVRVCVWRKQCLVAIALAQGNDCCNVCSLQGNFETPARLNMGEHSGLL